MRSDSNTLERLEGHHENDPAARIRAWLGGQRASSTDTRHNRSSVTAQNIVLRAEEVKMKQVTWSFEYSLLANPLPGPWVVISQVIRDLQ